MKKIIQLFVLVIFFEIICISSSFSSHIIGSDLSWKCVGNDSFLITLEIYRECNGVPIGNESINFLNAINDTTLFSVSIIKPSSIDITPTCNIVTTRCQHKSSPFVFGIEKYVYQKVVSFSSIGNVCNIRMEYYQCCRPAGISNTEYCSFFTSAELNRCLTPCDNSPVFTNEPATIVCINQHFIQSMGTIELDTQHGIGLIDSLSFELVHPRKERNASCPYKGSYSVISPLTYDGFPNDTLTFPQGFHLNPITGEIRFTPTKVQNTLLSIKVTEWRKINGIYQAIGYTHREFYIHVISCQPNAPPILTNPITNIYVNAGDSINLTLQTNDQNANDFVDIFYNNALPNASWLSNNSVKHGNATLGWKVDQNYLSSLPLRFTVLLNDSVCPLLGRSSYEFLLYRSDFAKDSISVIDSGCGNYFFYTNLDTSLYNIHWKGKFQNGFDIKAGVLVHQFTKPGEYTIGCKYYKKSDTLVQSIMFKTIKIYPIPDGFNTKDASCFGGTNGSATILHTGGTPPFRYLWSNGDTLQTTTNLGEGLYYVTINDSCNLQFHDSVIILEPGLHSIYFDSIKHVTIWNGTNGYARVSVHEGTPPFRYVWSNGDTTNYIYFQKAGKYSVIVSDSCNNAVSDTVILTEPPYIPMSSFFDSIHHNICWNGKKAYVSIMVNGGTPPYSYNWSNGDTTSFIINVAAGHYSVVVTDSFSDTLHSAIQILQPNPFYTRTDSLTHIFCRNDSSGYIKIKTLGDNPPFTHSWNNGTQGQEIKHAKAGLYFLKTSDSFECEIYDTFEIKQPDSFIITADIIQNIACQGSKNGKARINTIIGGTPNFQFLWSNGDTSRLCVKLGPGRLIAFGTDFCGNYSTDTIYLQDGLPIGNRPIIGNNYTVIDSVFDFRTDSITNANYYWFIQKGLILAGQGTYKVQVKWQNIGIDTLSVLVNIDGYCKSTSYYYPKVTVGKTEISNDFPEFYPNPASEILRIDGLNKLAVYTIRIIDINGKTCSTQQIMGVNNLDIDVSYLESGLYTISVISERNFYNSLFIKK
ncbi:MAG: T9SS type A sorting domain-containing protein [Bacteroidetes bacterium]|jgi:hypothetical protein|nr:T9SS type A sorting domain-containing protein [Bacteroidota bacterium]MBT4729600.1 T9SS type A sorting domain-containing protein [Bacteroidota bacterium]MBT5991429.1 T9SS type A sorting domain-containing protein [Bacteroidota bacterium]MBT6835518.1 T9SS type A sorting domain-containing protein [Bacteroidota bacterium]MBT7826747.1 T9SS type A sorting domain-containing protein [Bacteroidota bacterium]